jgi:hypothetical protein
MRRYWMAVVGCLALSCAASGAGAKPGKLVKEREAQLKDVNWLAVNSKGSELAVSASLDIKVLDAGTLKVVKTYRSAGRRVQFVRGDRFLLLSGVLRTGIELLDRKSGETTILN